MRNKLSTVKKVRLGFGVLTLVLVAAVGLTIWQVAKTQAVTHELVHESAPMSDASLRLINGLNNSALQLRGWMTSGELQFKSERAEAWSEWIEPSQANLKKMVEHSGDETQRGQFKLVEMKLKELKEYQQQIEEIARTDKNLPAHSLFESQGVPKADEVLSAVTTIIDEERTLEASADRKQLLYYFANFRLSLARIVESLRAFLASGSESDRQAYLQQWQQNVKAFDQIEANAPLLMGAQSLR